MNVFYLGQLMDSVKIADTKTYQILCDNMLSYSEHLSVPAVRTCTVSLEYFTAECEVA